MFRNKSTLKHGGFSPPVALIGLFMLVLTLTVAVALCFSLLGDFFTTSAQTGSNGSPAPGAASYPRLSDSLKSELDAARSDNLLSAEGLTLNNNPFADVSGVSLGAGKSLISAPVRSNSVITDFQPGKNYSTVPPPLLRAPNFRENTETVRSLPNTAFPLPKTTPTPFAVSSSEELSDRLAARRRDLRSGAEQTRPISELYAVGDVRPLGVVGRGKLGQQQSRRDIRFYSPVSKQIFIATPGAKFRDGTFESVNDTGVLFRRGGGETFVVKWSRSSEGKTSDSEDAEISVSP